MDYNNFTKTIIEYLKKDLNISDETIIKYDSYIHQTWKNYLKNQKNSLQNELELVINMMEQILEDNTPS